MNRAAEAEQIEQHHNGKSCDSTHDIELPPTTNPVPNSKSIPYVLEIPRVLVMA
jgi:hypothetical protein